MQKVTALKKQGKKACQKDGCERHEKGYVVTVNLADRNDANLTRYIREGKAGRCSEETLEHGLVRFHFPPGECPGHRLGWEDELPVYFVGERKTVHDEYHERLDTGAKALVAATTRLSEMEE